MAFKKQKGYITHKKVIKQKVIDFEKCSIELLKCNFGLCDLQRQENWLQTILSGLYYVCSRSANGAICSVFML